MTSLPVTSGHLRSSDVISWHVTDSSCELQHCRKWNVQYTRVFGLIQPLPGDFRSNDVTSRSLAVFWDHVKSFPVTWLPPPASYSHVKVKCTVHTRFRPSPAASRDFRSNDVTSGSLPETRGHFTSFPVTWLPPPASYSLVENETYRIRRFSAFYSHLQETSNQMTSLPNHFRSPEVTWRHFLSRNWVLLRATSL